MNPFISYVRSNHQLPSTKNSRKRKKRLGEYMLEAERGRGSEIEEVEREEGEGIGLGISTTKQLLERLGPKGSNLKLESRLGMGSRVSFEIFKDLSENSSIDQLRLRTTKINPPYQFKNVNSMLFERNSSCTQIRANVPKYLDDAPLHQVPFIFPIPLSMPGRRNKAIKNTVLFPPSNLGNSFLKVSKNSSVQLPTQILQSNQLVEKLPVSETLNILVLDDDNFNREIMSMFINRYFESQDVPHAITPTVHQKTSFEEALESFKANEYQLIFTDYNLEDGHTGAEFAAACCSLKPSSKPPIFVLISGQTLPEHSSENTFFHRTVMKPFSFDKISSLLNEILSK